MPAGSPNTVVGSHLIESIHSSHEAVVASDADGHRQVHDLSVATCCSHGVIPGVIGGNHTYVMPLAKHGAFCIGPLDQLQNDPSKCSREVSSRPPCCATHVGVGLQQVNSQVDGREEIFCVKVMISVKVSHQTHHYSISLVEVLSHIARLASVDVEAEAVAGLGVAYTPQLHPPLDSVDIEAEAVVGLGVTYTPQLHPSLDSVDIEAEAVAGLGFTYTPQLHPSLDSVDIEAEAVAGLGFTYTPQLHPPLASVDVEAEAVVGLGVAYYHRFISHLTVFFGIYCFQESLPSKRIIALSMDRFCPGARQPLKLRSRKGRTFANLSRASSSPATEQWKYWPSFS